MYRLTMASCAAPHITEPTGVIRSAERVILYRKRNCARRLPSNQSLLDHFARDRIGNLVY